MISVVIYDDEEGNADAWRVFALPSGAIRFHRVGYLRQWLTPVSFRCEVQDSILWEEAYAWRGYCSPIVTHPQWRDVWEDEMTGVGLW